MKRLFIVLLASVAAVPLAHPQSKQGLPASDPLYQTVAGLDSELFSAYNNCQLDKLGALVAEDLEFYHDKTGLAVGRQPFIDAIRNNICGKIHRELCQAHLRSTRWRASAPWRSVSTDSLTPTILTIWERRNSSRSGATKTAHGK